MDERAATTSLQQAIEELSSDKTYAQRSNAASLSARLMTFFMLSSFDAHTKWSWDELIQGNKGKVHILQFRG